MSKRTYEETCQRKLEAIQQQNTKEIHLAKKQKIKQDKILNDDKLWLKKLSSDNIRTISLSFYGQRCKLDLMLAKCDGVENFRNRVKNMLPGLYAVSMQVKPRARLARNTILPLKLYYLNQHPIFYMSKGRREFKNNCLLEFKLIPEPCWSTTFEAILVNFTTDNNEYQRRLSNLLNTVFTFQKTGLDWNLFDFNKDRFAHTNRLSTNTKVGELVDVLGVQCGIEWDLFWADLCDSTSGTSGCTNDFQYLPDSTVFTDCQPFRPKEEKHTPPWIYQTYIDELTEEKMLNIPDKIYPIDKHHRRKIATYSFINTGLDRQSQLFENLKRSNHLSHVMEHMTERIEYLEGADALQRHSSLLTPFGQHKEHIMTEVLSFLI